jgi:hypothetical protein
MTKKSAVFGRVSMVALPLAVSSFLAARDARAAIPDGYKGTPFGGTPRAIPGRIEFEDYDDGGMGVGWRVDDHTGNFGVGGCAGNAYRTDLPHPQICQTNTSPGENDLYSSGPMMGTHYPSDDMPQSKYIGYTHGVDWVKITVNVAKAGMYKVSSTWASEPGGAGGMKFQISFNDVVKADVSLTGTGGYHNWVAFPDFATVQLDAGVQVLQFAPKTNHINYDYLQFTLVNADGSTDPSGAGGTTGSTGAGGTTGAAGSIGSTGAAGTPGAAGDTGAAGTTGVAGSIGSTGAAGSVGSTGAAGDTGAAGTTGAAGDASGGTGAAGTGTSGTGAAGTGTSGTGAAGTGAHASRSSGGCAVAGNGSRGAGLGLVAALASLLVIVRRRSRRQ